MFKCIVILGATIAFSVVLSQGSGASAKPSQAGIGNASIGDTARVSAADWRGLDADAKDRLVRDAILGIRAGWIWGSGETLKAEGRALFIEKDAGRLDMDAIGRVSRASMVDIPTFSKSIGFYASQIDLLYAKAAQRKEDPAILLLCLADRPVISCAPGGAK
jgi:hypothetical protein